MPKVRDHRSHDGKKQGTDVFGVYEFAVTKLKVACVVGMWKGKEWGGKAWPKRCDAKDVNVATELKRVKAGK